MDRSRGSCFVAAFAAAAVVLSARSGTAQTGIRGWGDHTFDFRLPDDTFVEIAAGADYGLARRSDGTAVTWGSHDYTHMPALPGGVSFVQLAAGYGPSAALASDGTVVSIYGSEPPPLPPGVLYAEVAAGSDFLAALRTDGDIVVWDCYPTICDIPPLPRGTTYTRITAGFEHLAALRSDGIVVAWGGNSFHECEVTPPPPGLTYLSVCAGAGSTVALQSDGNIVTWGMPPAPDLPRGLTYVDVRLGSTGWHAFAKRSDGTWIGWGYGGPMDLATIPAPPGNLNYVDITSSWDNSWALLSDGSIFAWGSNDYGQLNHPSSHPDGVTYTDVSASANLTLTLRSDGVIEAIPAGSTAIPPGNDFVEVSAGNVHYLARREDGSVVAWGNNSYGQCNVPPLPPRVSYVEISAGPNYSLARRSDGEVVAWGQNHFGQCDVPRLPPGLAYTAIDAGGDFVASAVHTVALRSDGSAVAWGADPFGQCDIPPLPQGVTYLQVSAGAFHTLLVRSDGILVTAGANNYGQRDVPPLPRGVTYVQASGGWEHSAALRSDGTIVGWGRDNAGQATAPELRPGLRFLDVSAGHSRTVARYAGCRTCYAPFCLGDAGSRSVRCPCGNYGKSARGCDNSASTGGAKLEVGGSVDPDRVVLTATGEIPDALTVFVQARTVLDSPASFGDGALCVGGGLLRLHSSRAVGGTAIYPAAGDDPIGVRSASLGDPIARGTFRYYQVLYHDPSASFCRPASRFNASNAVMVAW